MAEENGENVGIESLGGIYPNKNPELRRVSKYAWECAHNTVKEGSAGATIGGDVHFVKRQKGYIEGFNQLLDELHKSPIPDTHGLQDTPYPINLEDVPKMITTDVGGSEIPLNEDMQLVTIEWVTLAVILSGSNSAGIRGSVIEHDHTRAVNQSKVIAKRVDGIEKGPKPDFGATADPGAKRED